MSTNQQPRHPVQPWQDGVPLAKPSPSQAPPQQSSPLPAQPSMDEVATMRASHADRERTVDVLKSAFAEGRLTSEEYNERVDRIYRAQTYGQLAGIVHDLPSGPMPTPYLAPGPVPAPFAAYPPQPYPQPYGHPQPYIYAQPAPGPYGYGYQRPYDRYGNPFAPPPVYRRPKNGLAVASLVLGLAQLPTFGATAIPAVICGHIAKSQIHRQDEEGDGMATAGLVLGWLGVAFWILIIFVSVASSGQGG
ncbi:DUF1707 and DUF4190 domain-containing protein [Streptacidiphilus sp. PAMC 29251]